MFPHPTDKPLTPRWTVGSSSTVTAPSSTVKEWPPRLRGRSARNTYTFEFLTAWGAEGSGWGMESRVRHVRRIGPNDQRYHLRDTSAQAFTMFTANTGYLQGGRDTKRHTRGYCSSRHQWHTLFGELRANHRREKSNYAVNCLFLQLSPLSTSVPFRKGPRFQNRRCRQHYGIHIKRQTWSYLFTSFGLKVRVFPDLGKAWVEKREINDIIALTTRFSYLNWQHQLKLFHSFLQWYI